MKQVISWSTGSVDGMHSRAGWRDKTGVPRKIWAKKASEISMSDPKPSGSSHPKKAGSFSNPETDGSPTRVAAMLVGDASRIMI